MDRLLRVFESLCVFVGVGWFAIMALLIRHVRGFLIMEGKALFVPAILALTAFSLGLWLLAGDHKKWRPDWVIWGEGGYFKRLRRTTYIMALVFLGGLAFAWTLAFVGVGGGPLRATGCLTAACYIATLALGLSTIVLEGIFHIRQRRKN